MIYSAIRTSIQRTAWHSPRRFMSTSISEWAETLKQAQAVTTSDYLDYERATQLHRTLPFLEEASLPELDDPLRKGHHLVYLQPRVPTSKLALDGTSVEYNAPAPFSRRMWAAGTIEFNTKAPLRIGRSISEDKTVDSVEHKAGMIFVNQRRDLRVQGERDVSVSEIRTHVFRPELGKESPKPGAAKSAPWTPPVDPVRTMTLSPSPSLLFRFSALTFNAHRIHYDLDWATKVEGHKGLVVHGPLSAMTLIELASGISDKELRRFKYRATSPLYVGSDIMYGAKWKGDVLEMWAAQDGKVGMRATAEFI